MDTGNKWTNEVLRLIVVLALVLGYSAYRDTKLTTMVADVTAKATAQAAVTQLTTSQNLVGQLNRELEKMNKENASWRSATEARFAAGK